MTTPAPNLVRGVRGWLTISGIVAALVGLLILIWPEKSAVVLTIVLAVYALVAGIVAIGTGIFARGLSGWARVGQILLGALYIVAAIIAFTNPAESTVALAIVFAIFLGITWIIEAVASLAAIGLSASKGWTVFYAIVSLLGGIALMTTPLWGAWFLWIFLGATLLVMGLVQIGRAISLGRN